jgi:hypothetical protein
MGIEIFLINEAFAAFFFLAFGVWGLLVFLERVEVFEKVGSLGWTGIVKGNVDVESARSLEGIVKPVGVVCGSE